MYVPLEIADAKKLPQGIPTLLVPFREQPEQKRGEQLQKFISHINRYHPDVGNAFQRPVHVRSPHV